MQANCLLLLAAAFWGFGNVAQKTVLDHLDPLSAVDMRCLIAGLMAAPASAALASRGPVSDPPVLAQISGLG
ncbi:EamA family transporter [Mesorhizobium sp.]|uniref:EamA family transporter n=1 Tax=Mesorhizobium sp. TaxID=1871066 RepID=UPI00257D8335|nr:EamA family transporter [Mesorhizobium sp.]